MDSTVSQQLANTHTPKAYSYPEQQQKAEQTRLNVEMLRLWAQQTVKSIQNAWNLSLEELSSFFEEYRSVCGRVPAQELLQHQEARLVRNQGKIFLGQVVERHKHGVGITLYREGRLYQGEYIDNEKGGFGCEVYANGNLYVGEYHQNKKHGHGSFFWFSLHESTAVNRQGKQVVEQYEGTWWGGLPDGKGQYEKANGDCYLGQFKNGLKHGEGIEYYQNGDNYRGEYVNGKPEGLGEYTWADGSTYKGDFIQGFRNGYGAWQEGHPGRQSYKGHYMLDKKHGYGIYDWGNRFLYKGNFFEDQRSGEGQLFHKGKVIYDGFWINGERCGEEEFKHKSKDLSTRPSRLRKKGEDDQRDHKCQEYMIDFKKYEENPESRPTCRRCAACQVKKTSQSRQRRGKSRRRH